MNKILVIALTLFVIGCGKTKSPIGIVDVKGMQTTIIYLNHKYINNIHACRLYYEFKIRIPYSDWYECEDLENTSKYTYKTSLKVK